MFPGFPARIIDMRNRFSADRGLWTRGTTRGSFSEASLNSYSADLNCLTEKDFSRVCLVFSLYSDF